MKAWESDIARVTAQLAASTAFAQIPDSLLKGAVVNLPTMEFPKLISDEVLAAATKAFDTSHITDQLAASTAFAQMPEALMKGPLAQLPTMEFPKLLSDEVLAAAAKALDTSHITEQLAASTAFADVASMLSSFMTRSTHGWIGESPAIWPTVADLLDELSQVDPGLLAPDSEGFPLDKQAGASTKDVGAQLLLLFVATLLAASRAAPDATDMIATLGTELLEEAVFLGKLTHHAYVEASNRLPDDNVLGWLLALAGLVRWLRSAGTDPSPKG